MRPAGNMMILASAGSGKTYALTNRFVQLLAQGAGPERIAALTFTRKAAGEFFDEILRKLARAARDGAYARKIAGEIAMPALGPPDFIRMLRAMIDAMPRLNLGTLDSFFARIVRAFPLELGLGGAFEIMEEHAARLERRRVLRRMFAHAGGAPDGAQQDFIEAFKRATFGAEEKQLGARLDAFLDQHAEVYLEVPEEAAWGREGRIWPQGCPWLAAAPLRAPAAAALAAALPWETLADGQRIRWEDFFAALPQWIPGASLPAPVAYLLGNTFKAWPEVSEVMVERKRLPLPPAASSALKQLAAALVGAEMARRLEMTRGIFSILSGYEAVYDGAVRRSGRLTFADLQRLLRPEVAGGRRILSREAAAEARLFIDWRLDAKIDHWLLDEFQDTSSGQWSILRNLVDEAVQDAEGTRSFFYVGDVKQAIFAWREGDPRLFREVFNHYNSAAPGTIREERLAKSYRSGPAVITMVNRVFRDGEALRRLFPQSAAERWSAEWDDHESAHPQLRGYSELSHAPDEAARFAATLLILQDAQPLARGLETAVLVQTNDTAARLADFLRREGRLPALAESDLHVAVDNPLTCALLALCRAAAHPGDEAAWAHLRMTPLAAALNAEELNGSDALTTRLLGEIHADGFERTLADWLRRLEPLLAADDEFSRERGRQFTAAARLFDASGGREVAEFLQFMQRHVARDSDPAAVVRVMTIHKAKGLGFDLVILPDLEGKTLAERRDGLAVHKASDRKVDWVLHLPSKEFFAHDPVLAAHVAAAEADACYENFCLLYVAMTRAKRAMYVITEPVGTSRSPNFPRLLQETLGEAWAGGDPRWFETIAVAPAAETARTESPVIAAAPAPRRAARRPSTENAGIVRAAGAFALEGRDRADFGRTVHALLAQVEWADAETPVIAAAWAAQGSEGEEALACLAAPELADIWARPAKGTAAVWRERAFEIVLDGAWVTGIFDRVVIARDAAGRTTAATVFDFKTGRLDEGSDLQSAISRHAGQMGLYRRAAAVLAGLASEAVAAEVIFTHARRRVRL